MSKEKTECLVCGQEFDYEPQYCCDGKECGCAGMPIDPPICSDECWKEFMSIPDEKEENVDR